jgi:hypothetical protein
MIKVKTAAKRSGKIRKGESYISFTGLDAKWVKREMKKKNSEGGQAKSIQDWAMRHCVIVAHAETKTRPRF